MPESFSFNPEIPVTRVPGVYLSAAPALATGRLPALPPRLLLVGGKGSGTALAGTAYRVATDEQAEALFSPGYQLTRMLKAARRNAPSAELWGCAIAEGASVKAVWQSVVSGTPTNGTINVTIGGHRVAVSVLATDGLNAIATAIAAAVTAAPDLPVTASANTATVTYTAKNGGEPGNAIDIRYDYLPSDTLPGVAISLTQTVVGSGNPDVAPAVAALGDLRWTGVITAYADAANMAKLEAEALLRAGPVAAREVIVYAGRSDTTGGLSSYGSSRNSPYSTVAGIRGAATPIDEIAAAYGALAEARFAVDPAAPLTGRALSGVLPPAPSLRFTWAERNTLLYDGIATLRCDAAGNVVVEREISTYQTDAAANADDAWLDITTAATVRYLRYATRRWLEDTYAGFKIADDDTRYAPSARVTTPKAIRAAFIGRLREYEASGLIERLDQSAANMIVERDGDDPTRVNIMIPVNLVNGLRIIAGQINFQL